MRILVLLISLLVGMWLVFFSVRGAVAQYAATRNNETGLRIAIQLEPGNPTYWYLLGRYQEYNLQVADSVSAIRSYQKAIELDPMYTDAWLELATAYELDDNLDESRSAYLQAMTSYPRSAEVSWRYGNFLLRQGDQLHAYAEIRKAVDTDHNLAAQAFSRAYRSNPDIEEILQQLLPANPRVYLDVVSQLARDKQLAAAQTVWKALKALHPKLEMNNVNELVIPLLQASDYAAATRVWNEGVATMSLPPLLSNPESVVWDPSFESGVRGFALAWRFEPVEQSVSVGLDRTQKLTGARSLRLAFDGKHNPNIDAACILAIVQPGTTYRFTGWIKTENVTTENGVEFRVYSPDDLKTVPLKTHEFHGTLPWTLVEGTWSAVDTHQAQVCITREASDNPDVRISGTAWVDEINLVPVRADPRKQ